MPQLASPKGVQIFIKNGWPYFFTHDGHEIEGIDKCTLSNVGNCVIATLEIPVITSRGEKPNAVEKGV